LITVSASTLELPARVDRSCTIENAGNIIAMLKKEAKNSGCGVYMPALWSFYALICMSNNPNALAVYLGIALI